MIETALKGFLKHDFALSIEMIAEKKEKDDLAETIKTLFDSEEIR